MAKTRGLARLLQAQQAANEIEVRRNQLLRDTAAKLEATIAEMANEIRRQRDVTAERDALLKTLQDEREQHSQALKQWAFERTDEQTQLMKKLLIYERFFTILEMVTERVHHG